MDIKSNTIKAVFFDIDGTICTDDTRHYIPESTVKAIAALKKNNILTFINSGRVACSIPDFITDMNFDGYICGCGTHIKIGNKLLFRNRLSENLCNSVVEMCRSCNLAALYESHEGIYIGSQRQEIEKFRKIAAIFQSQREVPEIESLEHKLFDKFCVFYDEQSDIESFKKFVKNKFDYIDRGNFGEIVPKGISKATGIDFVLKKYGLSRQNCCVIGDSLNDLPMFEIAGLSIAVGKTPLSPYADYVTQELEQDGVYNSFKHFSLI